MPVSVSAPRAVDTSPPVPSLPPVLAEAGYAAASISRTGGVPVVRMALGPTAVDGLLDSGTPVDVWLDSAFAPGHWPGVRLTGVPSGYWAFTDAEGWWVIVDHLRVGGASLDAVETKVEPRADTAPRAVLGATAMMNWGAFVDYATDTLYLLSAEARQVPTPANRHGAEPAATLRAALERAGRYKIFLALADRAGLAPLLDDMTAQGLTPIGGAGPDSMVWLGLRVKAAQRSGVATMPPNDLHLQITRRSVAGELRGPSWRTLFVPTDAAFERLPAETLSALRADPARLAALLRAHVYAGVVVDTAAMRTLIRGAAYPGPNGQAFGFYALGARLDVDRLTSWEDGRVVARAMIVDPDVKAAHGVAVAHGIDRVLIQSAAPSPVAATLVRQGYVAVPLYRREDGNGYVVRATVNGVPAQLTIATGVGGGIVVDQSWATRAQVSSGHDYVVVFDTLRLGSVRVETGDFSAPTQVAYRQGYRPGDGVVGSALLARYHARVDYAAGVLYLLNASTSRAPSKKGAP